MLLPLLGFFRRLCWGSLGGNSLGVSPFDWEALEGATSLLPKWGWDFVRPRTLDEGWEVEVEGIPLAVTPTAAASTLLLDFWPLVPGS